jgi:hypothetical protein
LCLLGPGEASECTRACGGACPAPDACGLVGGRDVCRPPASSSGCSVSHGRTRPASLLFWMFSCGVLLWRRRGASSRPALRGRR